MSRFCICLLFSLFSSICIASERLAIYVSIPPQKYLVEQMGSEFVDVRILLKPGQNPETYDPGPQQIANMLTSDLYFKMGLPFESQWLTSLGSEIPTLHFIDPCVCKDRLHGDPHIWTSLRYAMEMIDVIKDVLVSELPDKKQEIEHNHLSLRHELMRLDQAITLGLSHRSTDYFITSHGSWNYFSRDYGLIQLALEEGGIEKGTRSFLNLVKTANKEKIKHIFVQRQHPTGMAESLAKEIGAEIVMLDPLAEDYINNLHSVSELITGAVH